MLNKNHIRTACLNCRKAKRKCQSQAGKTCKHCADRGSLCILPTNASVQRSLSCNSTNIQSRATSNLGGVEKGATHSEQTRQSQETRSALLKPRVSTLEESADESSHIVGPALAQDAFVLEGHLTKDAVHYTNSSLIRPNPYNIYSTDPRKPVLYMTVPRQRQGILTDKYPGSNQLEIVEKLVEPFADELIDLYFAYINRCMPVLDEHSFRHLYKNDRSKLLPAVLCNLFASSLVFWHKSDKLDIHPPPDKRYVWNLAVKSLDEDFLRPGLTTICAALLDLGGRPNTSIQGNAITNGRTVSLAHSLGLNRDPNGWVLPEVEKRFRIRIWWLILIHDTWSSMCYGTPPHIRLDQHDVPLPDSSGAPDDDDELACFVNLCTLTEILNQILSSVYKLSSTGTRHSPLELFQHEHKLTMWLRDLSPALGIDPVGESKWIGGPSLHLSYLAVELLLRRLNLDRLGESQSDDQPHTLFVNARDGALCAAANIVNFVASLRPAEWSGFWLSYSGYHLASATTLLLRLAITQGNDFEDPSDQHSRSETPLNLASRMMAMLRKARLERDWDIGDVCLGQCANTLKWIQERQSQHKETGERDERISNELDWSMDLGGFEGDQGLIPDLFDMFTFE